MSKSGSLSARIARPGSISPASNARRGSLSARVEPLTKHATLEILAQQRGRAAHHDEKLGLYDARHGEMREAFDKARRIREHLTSEYDQRNQEILDSIARLRNRMTSQARKHLDNLGALSTYVEVQIAGNKASWKENADNVQAKQARRKEAMAAAMDDISGRIDAEREECKAHANSETEKVNEKLRAHDKELRSQVDERCAHHKDFSTELREGVEHLKQLLGAEAAARQQQWAEARDTTLERLSGLSEESARSDRRHATSLRDARAALRDEAAERQEAHGSLTGSMSEFMDKFSADIEKRKSSLGESKTKFALLKHTYRLDQE